MFTGLIEYAEYEAIFSLPSFNESLWWTGSVFYVRYYLRGLICFKRLKDFIHLSPVIVFVRKYDTLHKEFGVVISLRCPQNYLYSEKAYEQSQFSADPTDPQYLKPEISSSLITRQPASGC